MNYWKEIRKKTWTDWLKIVVAIDIAGVGVGLILGFDMHVFAHIFGFLSRSLFGVLYVFVDVLIFKRVFPQKLAEEEHLEAERMDEEIVDTTNAVKKVVKKVAKKANEITDKAHEKIDTVLDKGEEFIGKRKEEAKEAVDKLINE